MVKEVQQTTGGHPPPPRRALPSRKLMVAAGIGVILLTVALGSCIGAIVACAVINAHDCSPGPAHKTDMDLTKVPDRDVNSSSRMPSPAIFDLRELRTENSKLTSELQQLRSQQKQESILALPYLQHFEHGLNYGLVMTIQGFVQPKAHRLPVTLKIGPAVSDVALLFSPRFETNQMVRNHFHNGVWGPEETSGPVPVRFSQHFHYQIRVLQSFYEIFVDGVHYCDFAHRLPYNEVKYLSIDGDLILTLVTTHQMLL